MEKKTTKKTPAAKKPAAPKAKAAPKKAAAHYQKMQRRYSDRLYHREHEVAAK